MILNGTIGAMNVQNIERIFAIKPEEFSEDGVIKVTIPRTDIKVSVQNYVIDPFMGTSSWVSFQKGSKQGVETMIMGDIVLLDHEVNVAISAALENNIEVTALHNHLFYDSPKVHFMHINSEGKADTVATGVKKIFDAIKTAKPVQFFQVPPANLINAESLEKIIGVKGQTKNGIAKFVIGRQITGSCSCPIGKNMGINTWIAFGGNQNGAVVNGDFAVLENELQPLLKALRKENINVVAIHNHMIKENPRMLFVHFWGTGKAEALAQGFKTALDQTSSLKK